MHVCKHKPTSVVISLGISLFIRLWEQMVDNQMSQEKKKKKGRQKVEGGTATPLSYYFHTPRGMKVEVKIKW